MRRIAAGSTAFVLVTGTFLVLPVYAAPSPAAAPVAPSIEQVPLGSIDAPAAEALVTTDGELVAAGADAEIVVVQEPEGAAGQDSTPSGTPAPAEQSPPAPGADPAPSADPAPTSVPAGSAAPEPSPSVDPATAPQVAVPTTGEEIAGVPALTVSETDTDPFAAVGITWERDAAVTDVAVRIRVQQDGGWGEWTTLDKDGAEQTTGTAADAAVIRDGTEPYYTGRAHGIEVIVQTPDGATPRDVRAQLIDPGTSPADASLGQPQVQDQAHAALTMPPIYSRAQWGADESIRTGAPTYAPTIKAATLHHTAGSNNYSAAEVPGILRSIYAYHVISRAWSDIGYNVVVDRYGRAWEGRHSGARGIASPVIGAHSGGFNTGTFGISMLGDYATAPAPQAMVDKVAAVIGWKLGLYGVDPRGWTSLTSSGGGTSKYAAGVPVSLPTVFGHRDVGHTTCPGAYGYARLGEIRTKAAQTYVQRSSPTGTLDAVTPAFERATVRGWALDLDAPLQSISVHAYVDGKYRSAHVADRSRPDVARAYPPAGDRHGYEFDLALTRGTHQVCVYAINAGSGSGNPFLGCRSVSVPGFQDDPIGFVDRVSALGARIGFTGWALDGSLPTQPVSLHAYLDGTHVGVVTADGARPDIARVFPGAGEAHGFSGTVPASAGRHTLCLYALNVGAGSGHPLLGCSTVVVGTAVNAPIGSFDPLGADGPRMTVRGWMLDPNAPSTSGSVHVYVDGRHAASVPTDVARPDVVAQYPAFGVSSTRGYRTTLSLDAGTHVICVYAIDQGAGSDNPLLGCRTVTVPATAWNPRGTIDAASVTGITATVRGWAFDYDIPDSPSSVHVYVDGVFRKAVVADGSRPDVGAVFGVGASHGWTTEVSVPAGTHSVCVYALNSGRGVAHPHLGCRTVTVAASAWAAYGRLDSAALSGDHVLVRGWAVDPDDQQRSLTVHVYVNGARTVLTANASRPDIQSVYPQAGAFHGYEALLPLPAGGGPYRVCAYALGVGDGATNVTLGCRTAA